MSSEYWFVGFARHKRHLSASLKVNKRQKRGVYTTSGHYQTHERPKKGHLVALQVYLNFGTLLGAPNSNFTDGNDDIL